MKEARRSMVSLLVLVAVILAVTATAALAQPPVHTGGRYAVEFRNDGVGGAACVETSEPTEEDGNRNAIAGARQTATITIVKSADPADGTDFDFTSDIGDFTLDDADPDDGDGYGNSVLFLAVPASVPLDFVELYTPFWRVTLLACSFGSGTDVTPIWSIGGRLIGVTISAAPDDEIDCTFHNQPVTPEWIYLPLACAGYQSP